MSGNTNIVESIFAAMPDCGDLPKDERKAVENAWIEGNGDGYRRAQREARELLLAVLEQVSGVVDVHVVRKLLQGVVDGYTEKLK